jgi:FAS-associated factor 2
MTCIDRIEGTTLPDRSGPVTVEWIVQRLERHMERYRVHMERARAEQREREFARELREQQDAAYEASLRADREKQRKLDLERDKVRQQQEQVMKRQQYVQYLVHTLPTEPQDSEADTLRVSFRLADGRRVIRRFRASDRLEDVYAFVETLDADTASTSTIQAPSDYEHTYDFVLSSQYPRNEFPFESNTTLQSLDSWWPSVNLLVERL